MATEGKYVNVFIPEKLLTQIERFRYREEIPTRVQAIRTLIGRGLLTDDLIEGKTKSRKGTN